MDKLGNETDRLCQLYPEKAGDIAGKVDEAKGRWEALKLSAEQRKRGLDRSYNRHRFMADYRELCEWIKGIRARAKFNYKYLIYWGKTKNSMGLSQTIHYNLKQ